MSKTRLPLKGKFQIQHFNKAGELVGNYDVPNGIVDIGINTLLDVMFDSGSQITTWYIGLINNAGTPTLSNSDTMGSHVWTESQDYAAGTRPEWTAGEPSSRTITNAAPVDFAIDDTVTLKGIFIVSNNTKGGTTGILWSTAQFATLVTANNGDTLKVTYTVSG